MQSYFLLFFLISDHLELGLISRLEQILWYVTCLKVDPCLLYFLKIKQSDVGCTVFTLKWLTWPPSGQENLSFGGKFVNFE